MALSLCSLATSALAEPSTQASSAHCATLFELLTRYEHYTATHTGLKARAEIALDLDCGNGNYQDGIDELERMLRRGLIPLPPL